MSQNTEQQTVNKDWVDRLLNDLQAKLGVKEIENSALKIDKEELIRHNEILMQELQRVSDQLAQANACGEEVIDGPDASEEK